MKSRIKIYINDMIKNPSYFLIIIFYLFVSVRSLLEVKKSLVESGMSQEPFSFTFQYLFFVLLIGFFLFLIMICISAIVVSDKLSGRCEMLLANKVNIELLVKNYRTAVFFLCIIPIIILTAAFVGVSFSNKLYAITDMIKNVENIVFILAFLLFAFSLIEMIVYICLIVKKVEIIKSILSYSAIAFLFIVMVPVNQLRDRGWILDAKSLALVISAVIFVLSGVFLLVTFLIKRKYSNEQITLSFRQ